MIRRSGRPLDVVHALLLALPLALTPIAAGQDAVCPSDPDLCLSDGLIVRLLSNDELGGAGGISAVLDFVDADDAPPGTTGTRLCCPNLSVAAFLGRLDIDGDGVADNAPDTDGDGLPDNWETGGFEALTADGLLQDRVVFFPAPSAVVPGTPPTPIFTRLAVATSALNPDTDGDGISDFIEVFGLNFIDENHNGLLDSIEWNDINGDGLPSPGEHPVDNSGSEIAGFDFLHDFDGFVFTDPTNRDTDGDGDPDGPNSVDRDNDGVFESDNDPLINPRSFGNITTFIVRFNADSNRDIDIDGLGNGMDMGLDLTADDDSQGLPAFQVIDNPENISDLLSFFRQDLQGEGVIPEAQIEDLLGADWDGNGLWRTTDVRTWSIVIDESNPLLTPDRNFFTMDPSDPNSHKFYATQTFADLQAVLDDANFDPYGDSGIGMGWQDLLQPTARTEFIPDVRVWAILYSWRVPGFDIDGDGFIGVPNLSSTQSSGFDDRGVEIASIGLRKNATTGAFELSDTILRNSTMTAADFPFDDRINFEDGAGGEPADCASELDGQICPPPGFSLRNPCGNAGAAMWLFLPLMMLAGLRLNKRR